jgi:uncharacterized membrane protein
MQHLKKYRSYLRTGMVVFIISMLLLSITIWNHFLKSEELSQLGWLVAWLCLAILTAILILVITYRLYGEKRLKSCIEEARENERSEIMKEMEAKKETDIDIKEAVVTDVRKIIEDILPDTKGIKTIESYADRILKSLASKFQMVQGLCYQENKGSFRVIAKFAFTGEKTPEDFKPGETLGGQAALNQEMMLVSDIPESYFKIESGLGQSYPKHLVFVPVIHKKKTIALLEMAYFVSLDEQSLSVFRELTGYLGERFYKLTK